MIYIVVVREGDYCDNGIDDIADNILGVFSTEKAALDFLNVRHTVVEIADGYDTKGYRFGKVNYFQNCTVGDDYTDFVIVRKDF